MFYSVFPDFCWRFKTKFILALFVCLCMCKCVNVLLCVLGWRHSSTGLPPTLSSRQIFICWIYFIWLRLLVLNRNMVLIRSTNLSLENHSQNVKSMPFQFELIHLNFHDYIVQGVRLRDRIKGNLMRCCRKRVLDRQLNDDAMYSTSKYRKLIKDIVICVILSSIQNEWVNKCIFWYWLT